MSNNHEPVKPTPFSASPQQVAAPAPEGVSSQQSGRWIAPTLALLVVGAALVFLWLPKQVTSVANSPTTPPSNTSTVESATPTQKPNSPAPSPTDSLAPPTTPAAGDTTPYADGLTARERKEAKAVLSQVLDAQFDLEELGVERWATEAYLRATRAARLGDELYRQRDFAQAQSQYRNALEQLMALQERSTTVLIEALEQARMALESGTVEEASEAFEIAALLAPDSIEVAALTERLTVAPDVMRLREAAAEAERLGKLEQALAALTQANALDTEHVAIAAQIQRVEDALLRDNFSKAMSEGYAMLGEFRFAAAREAFGRAARLRPQAPETRTALTEVAEQESAHALRALAAQAQRAEAAERWQDAAILYEKAQTIDESVLFASEGLTRSKPRALVAKQITLLINEPKRLEDNRVSETAALLLNEARKFDEPNRVLSGQIQQLDELLRLANTPVPVVLRSDAVTEVMVQKVAHLGRFENHSLALRPGDYVAVGSRRGYRDVRRNFTVSHDGMNATITISCTEPI